MIVQILDVCKDGATKSAIMHKLSLSNSQSWSPEDEISMQKFD